MLEQTCGENQYMCRKVSPNQPHVRCIPNEWKCNGLRDCEENDDEDGCSGNNQQYPYHHPQVEQCSPGQHTCYGTGMHVNMPLKCLDRQLVW